MSPLPGTEMAPESKSITLEDQWLQQKEKTLAWLRVGFSVAAILVIQLNPERVARFPILSYTFLYSFLLYSLLILYLTRREKADSRKIGRLKEEKSRGRY